MKPSSLFPWFGMTTVDFGYKVMFNVISDRWSKYTVSWWTIITKDNIKGWLKEHLADKYFQKATHNTYAYRILTPEWAILEWKNDDGETGAWQCVLSHMQRKNLVNCIIVVTRYFWWIQLHADRFRHVVDATKMFINSCTLQPVNAT